MSSDFNTECLHFRGSVPCKPHKAFGVHCPGCTHVAQRRGRILIIKLAATGDVIRTTPLLPALMEKFPNHEIWWLTQTVDVLPEIVHRRLAFTFDNTMAVLETAFDIAINLDKDLPACALMAQVRATHKHGYTLLDGLPQPLNAAAVPKFMTGLFDDVNKANVLSYPEEIFAICDLPWKRQEYVVDVPTSTPLALSAKNGPIVGLNTGCGDRWKAREWPEASWVELIALLQGAGMQPVLLGGPLEHERNTRISIASGATYMGTLPYKEFFGVVNACDVVVTTVTMALHAAIGLKKRVVLLNNIFNRNEFELYGRGEIIEPPRTCECYFEQECVSSQGSCMHVLQPDAVFAAVQRQVLASPKS